MKCCICGPVRNCGPFLDKVFSNIEKIGNIFDDYEILIVSISTFKYKKFIIKLLCVLLA